MGRGIGDLLGALAQLLPPWALGVLVAIALTLLLPGFRFQMRHRQLRESVRRMIRAEPALIPVHRARALERAGDSAPLLAALVQEARKRSLPSLEAEAMGRLERVPHGLIEVARLRREVARPKLDPMHTMEVIVRVENLIEAGAVEAARARLDEALARTPGEPELLALQQRLDTEPPVDADEAER